MAAPKNGEMRVDGEALDTNVQEKWVDLLCKWNFSGSSGAPEEARAEPDICRGVVCEMR